MGIGEEMEYNETDKSEKSVISKDNSEPLDNTGVSIAYETIKSLNITPINEASEPVSSSQMEISTTVVESASVQDFSEPMEVTNTTKTGREARVQFTESLLTNPQEALLNPDILDPNQEDTKTVDDLAKPCEAAVESEDANQNEPKSVND